MEVYTRLAQVFGPQHWWPADSPFEMMVGAVLTQNTAWRNVERSVATLKEAGALSPEVVAGLVPEALQDLIRSSGFFRQKSGTLQLLATTIVENCQGEPLQLLAGEWPVVRQRLLALRGIGPETADSMLLYAGHHPIFVIDAYTRRIATRLGWVSGTPSYAQLQKLFMEHLPADVSLFNEYHALLVHLAKEHCLSCKPRCEGCPLLQVCARGQMER
ncbi:MAG: endonuclease III domain-containing protein [Desulfuromonadaceae bacterium]|nr:endonuclease III domain-containing protein [Desulfuromonadaceae bacterium]